MIHKDIASAPIKIIRLIRHSKTIGRQCRPIHRSIVSIPTFVIGIPIEWPPANETGCGDVGWDLSGGG